MRADQDGQLSAPRLARAAVRSVLAVAASNGVVSLITFLGGLYLMDRVSPGAFGVVKYAVALLVLFEALGDCGFAHGAIHRQERVQETFAAYFVLRLALTAAALCLLAVVVLVGRDFVAARTSLRVLMVLGAGTLLNAACDVSATRLRRDMRFGRLALVDAVSAVAATALGVTLAWQGFGLWALVAHRAAHALLRCVGLWLARVQRTRGRFERADAAWLFRFGLPLWFGGLATAWVLQYDDLVVGSLLGAVTLGHYDRAYGLALRPLAVVTGVLTHVSMPLYARLQDQRDRLSEAFRLVSGATCRLAAPMAVGLALIIPDFIAFMGWHQWAPVSPLFRWLLIYAVLRPLQDDAGGLLSAVGRPKVVGHTLIGQAAVLLVLCPVLTWRFGAAGAAASVGAVVVGGVVLWYVRYLPQVVDVAYRRIAVWPLASVAAGGLAAWGAAALMALEAGLAAAAVKLAVLCAVYLAALLALDGRHTLADLRTLWRHASGKQ